MGIDNTFRHENEVVGREVQLRNIPEELSNLSEIGSAQDGQRYPDQYTIRISSLRNQRTVKALIQEDIQLKLSSSWIPIVPTNISALGNILAQFITGGRKSLISKAMSRRIWVGSSPITMSLLMKFEAVDNAKKDVILPCQFLQRLALPGESAPIKLQGEEATWKQIGDAAAKGDVVEAGKIALDHFPTLSPPGPSPFITGDILSHRSAASGTNVTQKVSDWLDGGDLIMIELGQFVTFYNVIVTEVVTSFSPKFTREGDPISATARVVFETYEMPTIESLDYAYKEISRKVGQNE